MSKALSCVRCGLKKDNTNVWLQAIPELASDRDLLNSFVAFANGIADDVNMSLRYVDRCRLLDGVYQAIRQKFNNLHKTAKRLYETLQEKKYGHIQDGVLFGSVLVIICRNEGVWPGIRLILDGYEKDGMTVLDAVRRLLLLLDMNVGQKLLPSFFYTEEEFER